MTMDSTVLLGFIPLVLSHGVNLQISHRVIHPLLKRYLLSEAGQGKNIIPTLNKDLKQLNINYQIKPVQFTVSNSSSKDVKKLIISANSSSTDSTATSLMMNPSSSTTQNQRRLDNLMQVIFDLSMSFSLQIATLVIFEIIGFGNEQANSKYWNFTLFNLILLLYFLVPSLLIFDIIALNIPFLKNKIKSNNKTFFFSFVIVSVCWTGVSRLIDARLKEKYGFGDHNKNTGKIDQDQLHDVNGGLSFTQSSLAELALVGISCMAFLNGMGCITSLFYTYFKKEKVVKLQDVKKISDSLQTTDNLIDLRLRELEQASSSATTTAATISVGGLQHHSSTASSTTSFDLQDEVKALGQMKSDLIDELQSLLSSYNSQRSSHSLQGLVMKVYDYSFGIFCFYKIASIMLVKLPLIFYHEYFQGSANSGLGSGDPLATTIAKLCIGVIGDDEADIDKFSVNITLGISLCLFLLSFNSVRTTMVKFGKATSHSFYGNGADVEGSKYVKKDKTNNSTYILELLICELSGIYILSTILMLNSNTLPHHLHKLEEVGVGLVANEFVEVWFNKWFGLSCIVTLIVLFVMEHVEKMYGEIDLDDEDDIYDEEMMTENSKFS
ncbi:unnamed protein product [Ambrosiozyma monospora]|uniref:Unnamed protein product n=1 Tax=Ambrosiozyma monospora TaxID=43982 RepID=A0A9W7DDB1_AMBMO|nr:unnamed protein product [Ambrosiozyma monospora]